MPQSSRITLISVLLAVAPQLAFSAAPIRVGFLWHMHQPIYYPYESPVVTDANSRFPYSVVDIHNQRFGPYTTWPKDACQEGLSLPHLGAQVSFSGSLIENLNALKAAGVNGGMWNNWDSGYDAGVNLLTSLGNRRLDLVLFPYHHSLLPLLDPLDMQMQIRLLKYVYTQTWNTGGQLSHGLFPPETAFHPRVIPALLAEGVQWVIVDNIHFDRACVNYPQTNASGLFAPNPAEQINPDPVASGGAWVQLQNVWAPSKVSAPFGYRPHYVQQVDPNSGAISRIVAIPGARYEGNEDARGGYGAFLYGQVMNAYLQYNTDAAHPMFVVLHHDGDNYGGGTDAYYHSNFINMVNWAAGDPNYEVSTVEDYLARFPVATNDVIHVEPGAWAGADNGDAEFKKWLSDPDATGWSPDYNSWAVITAAKNRVFMANAVAPYASIGNVFVGTGTNTEKAWHWMLNAEASDYWYWDGQQPWDSNPTRACNQAVIYADAAIAGQPDTTPPTVFLPQRNPYNPGGYEWNATPESSDFAVWTFAYDVSGLASVTLKWRIDADGVNPMASSQNETYAGGPEVGAWNSVAMATVAFPAAPSGYLQPTYRAQRYSGMVTGQSNKLIDYYVEAVDNLGNVQRSDIQHVYVGLPTGGGGGGTTVTLTPNPPVAGQNVTITYDSTGRPLQGAPLVKLHYGFKNWATVISPDPNMSFDSGNSRWTITVPVVSTATKLDFVFTNGSGTWDNNSGQDWHYNTSGASGPAWTIDGTLDPNAALLASNNSINLFAGISGDVLYVATNPAGGAQDRFIYLARTPGALQAANWAKAGQIAAWDAFLADEGDNSYNAWTDATGTHQSATNHTNGVLEGTLNLREEFGSLPSQIYLAVGTYPTANGTPLVWPSQVPPALNHDGNIDANEYLLVDLNTLAGHNCPGDLDGDRQVNLSDLAIVLANYGLTGTATYADGDLTGDHNVDLSDLSLELADYGTVCP